jgi:hypothetical protein
MSNVPSTTGPKPADPTKVLTIEFRLSFPNLFEPKADDKGVMKYGCAMLFPKSADLSALKAAASAAGEKKWGADRTKWPKPLRTPFRDGNEKEYDGYKDHIYVGCSSSTKPGMVDHAVKPITDPSVLYAGCYCRATVAAYGYDKNGNKGIAFSLHNVQKLRDGAPFGSKRAAVDDFQAVAAQAKNPNGGGDPFADDFGSSNDEPPF